MADRLISGHPVGTVVPICNPRWRDITHAVLWRISPHGDDWRAKTAAGTTVFAITWDIVQRHAK